MSTRAQAATGPKRILYIWLRLRQGPEKGSSEPKRCEKGEAYLGKVRIID